jgi:hypothetical protein
MVRVERLVETTPVLWVSPLSFVKPRRLGSAANVSFAGDQESKRGESGGTI